MSQGKTMKVYMEAVVYDGVVTLKRPNGMLSENVKAVVKGTPWKPKGDANAKWSVFVPCYLEDGTLIGQLCAKSTEVKPSKFAPKASEVVEATA